MNARRIIPLVGIALTLNGCTLIPKYTRPDSPMPGSFPGGGLYTDSACPEGALPAAGLKLQTVFPDAKLQKVIAIALENNRDLRLAMLNVERTRALYGVQRAETYPAVDAAGAGSKQRVPADLSTTGKARDAEQYSVNLGITSWEIDLFGRLRSLSEQAKQEYLGSEQTRRAARVSLISEVAAAYFTLAADRENLKISESTLEAQRSTYGVIWQQYDKGIATEMDLRRSQTQVETARADVSRYTRLVEQDKNSLNLLAGASVPEDLLPPDLAGAGEVGTIATGLSSEVLLRRPDIIAAEHQLKAAYAFIGAARAAFFPRIALTTTFGTASAELEGLFDSGSRAWSFVPQTSMPIFDARVWAAYRVSKANREIALTQYEKTIQSAFREVSDALATRGMVDQQLAVLESIVEASQKIYEQSNQRYIQGIDNYLNVLDAQRSLFTAQRELTLLRLAKLVNQVRFYAVLGGDNER